MVGMGKMGMVGLNNLSSNNKRSFFFGLEKMNNGISNDQEVTTRVGVGTEEPFHGNTSYNYELPTKNMICRRKSICMINTPSSAGKYNEEKENGGPEISNALRTTVRIDSEIEHEDDPTSHEEVNKKELLELVAHSQMVSNYANRGKDDWIHDF
ncbi:hypothetical protein ACOSP7_001426 [Xanthoceras sorbifolium]